MVSYGNDKDAYLKRLRRIEGQVRGLQRMVEEEKYCIDILTQVSAMTKALQAVSLGLLEEHMNHCVVDAARAGDAEALDALRIVGESLGVGIANAINTFDPDLVVVGGGVSTAGELLLGPARDAAQRFVVRGVGTRTQIRLARYGPQAGVRGATLLAGQELEVAP